MPKVNVDTRDTLYVARQPILEAGGDVFGYELLYRADADDLEGTPSQDLAAARVLSDAVLNVGLETLTGGRPAFINLSRSLLLGEVARLLPPTAVVFELHDIVRVDEAVVEACRRLHEDGYAIALCDFVPGCDAEALLPYARFVKVDVLTTPLPMQRELAKYLAPSRVRMVAEHVETAEVFDAARAEGYALFQGHYFCLPKMCSAAAVRSRHVAYMQLLAALNRPGLSLSEVEDLIKHDVSLSYRVLRCINSAAFGLRREIKSIREALLLMGLAPIRSWASVWCMAGLNTGGTSELVTVALVRARCCELIGEHLESEEAPELFLIGLCSLLDAMLGRPLEDAVADLPLSPGARDAVLGMRRSPSRSVLNAVIAYERGAWDLSADELKAAGLQGNLVAEAYTGALSWARELTQAHA
jgi:c-di-GMP-related signal transduction protein